VTTETVELTVELFENLKGESLRVDLDALGSRQVELRLAEVRRLPLQHSLKRVAFTLELSGSVAEPLQQGTYRFFHTAFGSQPIFIVPVAQDRSVRRYEAIFN